MPIPVYDSKSGAVIMHLTPAEKEMVAIKTSLKETTKQNEDLIARNKILEEENKKFKELTMSLDKRLSDIEKRYSKEV